jgi:hypothetical protein
LLATRAGGISTKIIVCGPEHRFSTRSGPEAVISTLSAADVVGRSRSLRTMTSVPIWVAVLVAVVTPVLTFLGVLWAQHLGRQASRELEARSRREEVMRNVRWASELSVDSGPRAQLGVAQLKALGASRLADDDVQVLIDAALQAVVSWSTHRIDAAEKGGGVEVQLDPAEDDEPGAADGGSAVN